MSVTKIDFTTLCLRDALDLAILIEEEAEERYEELRDEEVEHQRLLEAELKKLPPDPPGDPGDFEAGPVAQ